MASGVTIPMSMTPPTKDDGRSATVHCGARTGAATAAVVNPAAPARAGAGSPTIEAATEPSAASMLPAAVAVAVAVVKRVTAAASCAARVTTRKIMGPQRSLTSADAALKHQQ